MPLQISGSGRSLLQALSCFPKGFQFACSVTLFWMATGCGGHHEVRQLPQGSTNSLPSRPVAVQALPTSSDLSAALAAVQRAPRDAHRHYALARIYIGLGHHGEGEKELRTATRLDPRFVQAFHALQRYYFLAKYLDREIEVLLRLQKLEPKQARHGVRLGQIYLRLYWMNAARSALNQALSLSPSDSDANLTMAKWYMQSRNPTEALARIRTAHGVAPDNNEISSSYAQYLYASGHALEAEALLRESLRRAPGDRLLSLSLIYNLVSQGGETRCREVVALCKQFLQDHGPAVEAYCWQGRAYEKLHQDAEAEDAYKHALKIDPSFENVTYLLGRYYLRSGKTAEGTHLLNFYTQIRNHLQAYSQAEERVGYHEKSPDAHLAAAQLDLRARYYPESIVEYKRVLALRPDDVAARSGLRQALTAVSRHEEALDFVPRHGVSEAAR